MKIVIVGPEERKWPNEEAKERAKKVIESILHIAKDCKGLVGHEYRWTSSGFPSWFNVKPLPDKAAEIEVISGHCPVGREMWYCVDCNGWDGTGAIPDPHPSEKTQREHRVVKVYDKGGADTWVEMKAAKLGVKTDIHKAEVNQWNDRFAVLRQTAFESTYGYEREKKLKGFRSRNIDMAKAGDVGYCIVPKSPLEEMQRLALIHKIEGRKDLYCSHCDTAGHPRNGGCFTIKEMRKLGKETHLVVIE